MFLAPPPTHLLNTSGPLTLVTFLQFKTLANYLAMRVFPVPGGPYKIIPLV